MKYLVNYFKDGKWNFHSDFYENLHEAINLANQYGVARIVDAELHILQYIGPVTLDGLENTHRKIEKRRNRSIPAKREFDGTQNLQWKPCYGRTSNSPD